MEIEELKSKLDRCNIDSDTLLELTKYLEEYQQMQSLVTTLEHRCYALTRGTLCSFCKYECYYKYGSK